MCGFTALAKTSTIDQGDLARLTAASAEMRYRGPDEQGLWHDNRVGLSHVRLSIIGITNGHQPIRSPDGRFVLICNGEIYNYRDLKLELEERGHRFQTLSDSEVIIYAYAEYGLAFLNHLDGMFSFVLYDTETTTVIAARDTAGKKPLYFSQTDSGIVFSSELKTIAHNFLDTPIFNYEVLRQVQAQRYSITETATFIEGISKIAPGHVVVCNNGKLLENRAFHQRRLIPDFTGSYDDAVKKTRDLLIAAVKKRLESEVPMGMLLSAGIDSSTIACIAALLDRRLTAFSASYKGYSGSDESYEAEQLAREIGLPFERITLDTNGFVNEFSKIMDIIDEPNADPAMFPQWALFNAIHRHGFKVIFSGIGGDEVFFGYPSKNTIDSSDAFRIPSKLQKLTSFFSSLCSNDRVATTELIKFLVRKSLRDRTLFKKSVLNSVNEASISHGPSRLTMSSMVDPDLPTVIDRTYSALYRTYLPNNGFFLADKLGMAHSIEVRCPFADRDLRSFVDSLPLTFKFPRQQAKGLLKDALKGLVPDRILNRRKTGFTPPSNYIQDLIEQHQSRFFPETLQTLAQVVTDAQCASYRGR